MAETRRLCQCLCVAAPPSESAARANNRGFFLFEGNYSQSDQTGKDSFEPKKTMVLEGETETETETKIETEKENRM